MDSIDVYFSGSVVEFEDGARRMCTAYNYRSLQLGNGNIIIEEKRLFRPKKIIVAYVAESPYIKISVSSSNSNMQSMDQLINRLRIFHHHKTKMDRIRRRRYSAPGGITAPIFIALVCLFIALAYICVISIFDL